MTSPLATGVASPHLAQLPASHPPPPSSESDKGKSRGLSFRKTQAKSHHNPVLSASPSPTSDIISFDGILSSGDYASLFDSCRLPRSVQQIHAHALKSGYSGDEYVDVKLLEAYGRLGCFADATMVFDNMPVKNVYSWRAILDIYVEEGYLEEAFQLFLDLQRDDVELEFFVFPVLLRICCGYGGIRLAREMHGIVIKNGCLLNIYVANALIDTYGKCGSLDEAKKVFNHMNDRDRVSWNSIVTACADNEMVREALDFLERMSAEGNLEPNLVSWSAVIGGLSKNEYDEEAIEMLYNMNKLGLVPNARTLASALPSCSRLLMLELGKEIHAYATRHELMSNPFVVNGLIDLYRRCKAMLSAWNVFSFFSTKNEVSYNTMIVGYCNNGDIVRARELFNQMKLEGKRKGVISWNSMISGLVSNLKFDEALCMFRELVTEGFQADTFTLGSLITACTKLGSVIRGKELQSYAVIRGLQTNPFVGGALVEMYSNFKDITAAQKAFDEVAERDAATWNALISGYAASHHIENVKCLLQSMQEDGFEPSGYTWNGILAAQMDNDQHEMALELFSNMQSSNLRPDVYAVGIAITACSRLASIRRGMQVHAFVTRSCYESDSHIGAGLIDMYAKCGSIKQAKLVYDRIKSFNLVTENAMLTAYSMHGYGKEGIALFRNLLDKGVKPDSITFLSALSSCVHAGAVKTGQECFYMMKDHGVVPSLKHYTCVVDLLSRAGKFDDAIGVIRKMPMEPDPVTWGALLGGCVIHGDINLGEVAANKLIEMEPQNAGNHVILANLYASAGRWGDSQAARIVLDQRQMHKSAGCSWIEDKDEIHVFVACDRSHSRVEEIYTILENLTNQMRLELAEQRTSLYHTLT